MLRPDHLHKKNNPVSSLLSYWNSKTPSGQAENYLFVVFDLPFQDYTFTLNLHLKQ